MKRGKDDEKIMGPMFPRLHVNDKDKGGPRAPPRNKMALYEQLSIPSQRFNPSILPLNPSNTSNSVPPGSSSQGGGQERNLPFPFHVHPSMPKNMADKFRPYQIDGGNLKTPTSQLGQKKRAGDEDDFRVPVYVNSGMDQCNNETQNSSDRERPTPFTTSHSVKFQNVCVKDPKRVNVACPSLRQEVKNHSDQNPEVCVSSRDHSVKSATNLPIRKKADGNVYKANLSPNQEYPDHRLANFGRYVANGDCLQGESRAVLQRHDSGHSDEVIESARYLERADVSQPRSRFHSREESGSPSESHGDRARGLPQPRNEDKSDDASETSMVDSMSGLDISPDDVVGIIGQKHFWKARRAIVNQQRVFAVQVFELHRLIKVQRLIAASPDFLSDGTYLVKPSMKSYPAAKVPIEYVVTPSPHVQSKDDIEKPNHNMERSAETAVVETSISPGKIGSQPLNFGPPQVPVATDTKMAPWCFHSSPGHQWLVPVMSPSEGLIYKPYPAPGFVGNACGGYGPFGPTPLPGNFLNPSYSIPTSNHNHQGFGVLPGVPTVGQNFFPPYGMPFMNTAISSSAVEQTNWFVGPGSHGQTSHLSETPASFNTEHQNSCSVPTQKSGALPQVTKFQASRESEVQGSTPNSPIEKGDGTAQRNGALPLFPIAGASQPHGTDQPRRVIKVTPHNRISASESVARIFQSMQEERKQHEST
ncbi:protein EARLY FLOWERING 3 isoform X2 [Tripterygium wilfordii]|uniref:Protein EARLY FLOWERING 3 isoform X2 n=1 Tax=Tripterygium wilfordii TaxID=458696 RepID=A0A7J7BWW6_TRIWF|nr:protein EARLY FLOWERING 3-like [Tripterygium wilfordii]XP_038696034.1 protein EARLY FLOWERING 3-like [Tripterygium wilfordii]XP_038696035.1 protein EARLY FLOWERING 3-like [Tripterygium wilfordii]XP_038696036.1 protein EARLY FLOWERING 3-like [Tripterygium wilfordii]KAF5726175.1 protein EARLY FLOWERING 3 isoform X2 [Tripterygium wilfordii]